MCLDAVKLGQDPLAEQSVALFKVTTDQEACSLHLQDLATRIWNTKVSKVSLTEKSSDHPGKSISPSVPKKCLRTLPHTSPESPWKAE